MKIKVLCKVIQIGPVHGKTGEVIEVPDDLGEALCKGGKNARAEEVKSTDSAKAKSK